MHQPTHPSAAQAAQRRIALREQARRVRNLEAIRRVAQAG